MRAGIPTAIYTGASSDSIFVELLDVSSYPPTAISGWVKLYIDGDYVGLYGVGPGGIWIWIPSAYQTPGDHSYNLTYDGDETYDPSEAIGYYTVLGSEPPEPEGCFSENHIFVNGTGVSCQSTFNYTTSDFNGFWLKLYNVSWTNYREWWQFETINDLYVRLNITTASGSALVVTKLHGGTSFFGALNTFHVSVGASDEAQAWDQVSLVVPSFYAYGLDYYGWHPEEFELFVKPEANQTRIVWIWDVGGKKVAHTVMLPEVLDGSTTVRVVYEHEGDGLVEGYVTRSFTLPAIPYYEDFKSGVGGWLSEILGIDLGFAVQILLTVVVLFLGIVRMTLPLLGVIVFLWIIDTIYTAVTTGEIRLIGDMFLRIYDLVMAIWRTLVNIIQAIWDLITFWS